MMNSFLYVIQSNYTYFIQCVSHDYVLYQQQNPDQAHTCATPMKTTSDLIFSHFPFMLIVKLNCFVHCDHVGDASVSVCVGTSGDETLASKGSEIDLTLKNMVLYTAAVIYSL